MKIKKEERQKLIPEWRSGDHHSGENRRVYLILCEIFPFFHKDKEALVIGFLFGCEFLEKCDICPIFGIG